MKKKPLRILSIDDDRGCQLAAAKYFTIIGGHIVEVAENGREGIMKAEQLRPDIILLDMSMPDMDGSQVIEALACTPATRDIPVILVTGSDIKRETLEAIKRNRNFLSLEEKPASFEKMLKEIETIFYPQRNSVMKNKLSTEIFPEPS